MLSSRGSLSIDAVFNEALSIAPATHGGPKILPITDAHNAWAAIGSFLHAQMLLGHAITIPKFCSFWTRQKHVATHGNLRYYVRELCFGFSQHFITTFNLDPMVPMEDLKIKYIKMPFDIISMEAKVPADICQAIVSQITLFIGEGCFRGKSFMIEVPEVLSFQVKKERAHVMPNEELTKELFAIDSRKWPAGVREVASAQLFRPRSSSSSASRLTRSGSAAGRPPTSSSTAAATPRSDNRPMFVTALPQNKSFAEIEAKPVTEIRHKPRLPGSKLRAQSANKHVDPLSPSQMLAASALTHNEPLEEESVYDVLSPSRKEAAHLNAIGGNPYFSHTPNRYNNEHDQQNENALGEDGWQALNPVPRLPLVDSTNKANTNMNAHYGSTGKPAAIGSVVEEEAVSTATPIGAPSCCKHIKAVFPWETALDAATPNTIAAPRAPLYGRKRFVQSVPSDNAKSLLYDNML